MTFDMSNYDAALLSCRPWDPENPNYPEFLKETWERIKATPSLEMPPSYPGRIKKQCEACQVDVQVGPKQQQMIEQHGDRIKVVCLICAAMLIKTNDGNGGSYDITDLGNEYKEKK